MAKYALVVGIDQYSNFRNLKSAAKDAEAVAQLLEAHNYRVTRLPRKAAQDNTWEITSRQSVSQSTLQKELKEFFQERSKQQDVVFYFAGHGFLVTDDLTDEYRCYLGTSDARSDGQNAIPFDSLNRLLSSAELSSLVVLLDCCHAGSLIEQQQVLQPIQTTLSRKRNSCLIAACRDFERARENAEHGIFTAAILKGLAPEGDTRTTITSNDLFGFVERELRASGQEVIHAGMGSAIDLVSYPALHQKATNKNESSAKIFISYRSEPPDYYLAEEFYTALQSADNDVFMAAESLRLGDNWSQRIERELSQCDYFLLFLSSKSANSEMVTEEVRRAKELRDTRKSGKPIILPIRVQFPLSSPLNYDLKGYLDCIQQREWNSADDTKHILKEIQQILIEGAPLEAVVVSKEKSETLIEKPDTPPIPVAPPELPGGQVDLASLYYVERPHTEDRCYETVLKPGALIRIKAPRQMGKTSLMSRVLRHGENQRYLVVPLSFQLADAAIFSNLDKFLRWFCATIGRRLKLANKINDYWDEIFGSKDNCTAYMEEYVLPSIASPLVLGLDEVDMVFKHPNIAADFMGLLRAWHESSKVNDLWKKLRLLVVHSTEVYIPMNINQSPFNVGLPIELSEFLSEQVLDLAQRHGLAWSHEETNRLMAMVGGHPYLIRVALYQIARNESTLDDFLKIAPTDAGPYGDHLRRHWWNLEQRLDMAEAAKRVVTASGPVRLEPIQAFQLHSMGIVHLQDNEVIPRCDLYRQYFSERLTIGRTSG
jgi:hypothetical protein